VACKAPLLVFALAYCALTCAAPRRAIRDVIYPTLCALGYMHSENIIHRDVKPENTLVAEDGAALLADFGLSMDCGLERPATRLGTLDYMAPEVCADMPVPVCGPPALISWSLITPAQVLRCPDKDANSPPGPQLYDGQVDSWAVGILAFEVLVGRAPFEQDCKQTTCDLICYGDFVLPAFLSAQAKDFISRALCKNAAARPSIAELLAHAWVSSEARRTSNTERGGVGSFLLQRVFKDGAASSALKSRVDAAVQGTRLRPQQAAVSPKTPRCGLHPQYCARQRDADVRASPSLAAKSSSSASASSRSLPATPPSFPRLPSGQPRSITK
jgi:serine/threonine protein kinase